MGIGTGAAILGGSLISGASSLFGARGANRAAQANARAAAENAGYANQTLGNARDQAFGNYFAGRDAMVGGLQSGRDAWWNQMGRTAGYANPSLTRISAADATFDRNPNIGGQWANLQSQNFLQSPDYKFRQQEGLNAVQGSAAAQGGLYSGNTLRDITDYASNLAAGEYSNWFGRQQGLADRMYGADVANYDRAANQFADNWGRQQDRDRYMAGVGLNALGQGAELDRMTQTGIGQANADLYGQRAATELNTASQQSGNYMGNAQTQANTPYVSPWGGINQAVQGGLQNYLWAQNAGLMGGGGGGQNVFSAGPSYQTTYGGAGNYGHVFNPLFGGSKPTAGATTYPYPGGPQTNYMRIS